jgi:2-polyprenyl-3-methyl-5-hydroxy-6-metoxy-1,4-benzoquinol methylase
VNIQKIPKRVGSVPIKQLSSVTEKEYTDGDSEDFLLQLFQSQDAEEKRRQLLGTNPEWRLKYHIAYTRENLFNWYDFKPGSSVLEVGAGCGALTGLLARKCKSVDALDISARRSLINANRNRDAKNLTIIIGNLQHLETEASYDYATSIGVLEYAGRFIKSKTPYEDFLKQMYKTLKPGGTLVLAIENQLGIKYWAGSHEDHTGRSFESIEDYPDDSGIRTFGRHELEQLLQNSGFDKNTFYYPFPDYKMPVDIYSDDYLPGVSGVMSSDLFPTPAPDQPREYLFDEFRAMGTLGRNELFPYFANSFLVFAQKGTK